MRGGENFCHCFLQFHGLDYYRLLFSRSRLYVLDSFTTIATQLKHDGLCGTKGILMQSRQMQCLSA